MNNYNQIDKMIRRMGLNMEYQIMYGANLDLEIVSDHHIDDYAIVTRTWKERLFTRPFNPFKKTKKVESSKIYTLANGSIVCSLKTKRRIEKELKDLE